MMFVYSNSYYEIWKKREKAVLKKLYWISPIVSSTCIFFFGFQKRISVSVSLSKPYFHNRIWDEYSDATKTSSGIEEREGKKKGKQGMKIFLLLFLFLFGFSISKSVLAFRQNVLCCLFATGIINFSIPRLTMWRLSYFVYFFLLHLLNVRGKQCPT